MIATRPRHITLANKSLAREARAERQAWVWLGRLQWFAAGMCAGCYALWLGLILS